MDDISELLSSVLENPELTEKLKNIAGDVFGAEQPQKPPKSPVNTDMLSMVSKFAPILSAVNEDDDNTRLLMALKPFLEEERSKKLDEAVKIMRILRVLPILKNDKII